MAEVIVPTWEDFRSLVVTASRRLVICSPFYSESGIERIFDHLNENVSLVFYTRLSPPDWANRISDPRALLILLDLLAGSGHKVDLYIHQRLHAKVYIADDSLGLLGSANLSEGGFRANFEMMVRLRDAEASQALDILRETFQPQARCLPLDQFQGWVNNSEDIVRASARSRDDAEAESLEPVQRALDELLNYGRRRASITEPVPSDMDRFVEWLKGNRQSSGAEVLYNRHFNLDGNNLTGHFRQSFYATMRFLREEPYLIPVISGWLNVLHPTDIYQPSASIRDAWVDHFNNHATDTGEGYSYSVLRGILPPSLGGTRPDGGGGISTFKRMLPLVARYLEEAGRAT